MAPPPASDHGDRDADVDDGAAGDSDLTDDPHDLDAGTREHYADAALYDFEYRRRRADVNHYRRLARAHAAPGPIVELGCGSGRVLVPLLRDGHEVIGVDRSPAMLAQAAARIARLPARARGRARLIAGDLRQIPLAAGRFSLVISPFNVLQHFYTRGDLDAVFDEARRLLHPAGRFAFDVLNPDLRWLTRDPRKRWARTIFRHPTTNRRVEYTTNQTYDPISQIAYIRIYYRTVDVPEADSRTEVVRLTHRQIFPAELEGICTHANFFIEERWGGFAGEVLDGSAESQVFLCKRR